MLLPGCRANIMKIHPQGPRSTRSGEKSPRLPGGAGFFSKQNLSNASGKGNDLNTSANTAVYNYSGLLPALKLKIHSLTAAVRNHCFRFIEIIRTLGFTAGMDEYEKRKLGIFNQVNLFQFCAGLLVPVILIVNETRLDFFSAFVIISPPLISLLVLYLNSTWRQAAALISYFVLYPFFTSLAYINGLDMGVELFFVLYGILSVFFLKELSHIIFSIAFNMVNYFMLAVVLSTYRYSLETNFRFFYLFNQLLAICFIFYGLYLIKKENTDYQYGILHTNEELKRMNDEIIRQKEEIAEKARQLEQQATRLNEMDAFKNRLFSIVSHDLKAPLYAMRNLFTDIQENRIPATVMSNLLPQVVKDMNYVTGLTDNLLHWAKSQMQTANINPQLLDLPALIDETVKQQRLQAELKGIKIRSDVSEGLFVIADRDMINLVLRNLLSNAIKFSPHNSGITVGASEMDSSVEVFVADSGAGISPEALEKIKSHNYYSTKGTANESGTGLGLMLVKEFLEKNNGQLHIESRPGRGSIFSFTLPKAEI